MSRKRVVFVQPGFERGWGTDFTYKEQLPHIGLAYVAAAARAAGHDVAVVDGWADGASVDEVARRAVDFDPDVVAITANSTQVEAGGQIAARLRAARPECLLVLGGYHVSPIPVETLEEFPQFDAAVFGEGEQTVVELLAACDGRDVPGEIAGVAVRRGKEITKGPARETVVDLDRLPLPAFDLFPLERYYAPYTLRRKRALTLTTARGCPYRCVFCQNPGGLKYRYRSIDLVLDEVALDVERHGAQLLFITDETFTLHKKRAREFCEGMLRRGLHRRIQWACETRVDAVDAELIALMRRAGCYSIFFGIESGNQDVLDGIKKKIDKEEALRAIRWSRESGIFTHTGFIFGHPNETRETINDTIDFALSVDSDACSFSIMIPFPGTPVLEMARAGVGGLRLLSTDWKMYGGQVGAALELDDVPRAVLERLQFLAYARFYARPRKWLNFMKTGRVTAIPIVLGHMAGSQARAWLTPRPRPQPVVAPPPKKPETVRLRTSREAPPIA